jgi:hypothetical protein
MRLVLCIAFGALFSGMSAYASTSFAQCPAVGNDTSGCEFLITITSASGGMGTNFTVTPSSPDLGPYDGSDDTLVGVLNNTTSTITSLGLTSSTDIFGFDGDGACSGGTIAGCAGATDPSGYAPVGVTFSNISPDNTTGIVNFSPGLAPGGSQWFSLEEALTPSQIMPSSAPEPASVAMLSIGLGAVGFCLRRRAVAKR